MSLEALKAVKRAFLNDERWDMTEIGQMVNEAIAEAEKQEPVAWMFQHDETGRMTYLSNDGFHNPTMFIEMNPRYALVCSLYTHPQPKREPPTHKDFLNWYDNAIWGNEDFKQGCWIAFEAGWQTAHGIEENT